MTQTGCLPFPQKSTNTASHNQSMSNAADFSTPFSVFNNISWVDRWYEDSLRYVPKQLCKYFLQQLKNFEI